MKEVQYKDVCIEKGKDENRKKEIEAIKIYIKATVEKKMSKQRQKLEKRTEKKVFVRCL